MSGDRQAQLRSALHDKYSATVSFLPAYWSPTQVFTVDVDQDWDDPEYDQPPPTFKGCLLQPGATSAELNIQCAGVFGFHDMTRGGASSENDKENRSQPQTIEELQARNDGSAWLRHYFRDQSYEYPES